MVTLPSRTKAALLTCAALTFTTGCHNKDSTTTKQVTWTCPTLAPGKTLPKKIDKEDHVTYGYKMETAVRFHFVDQPDQYVDLYQPGLCQFLQSQGTRTLPMTLGLTYSPKGKLLSYEEVSIPGHDLSTGQQTRTSLYLESDKGTVAAMDKATRLSKEDEYVDEDPIPAHRMPIDQLLQ